MALGHPNFMVPWGVRGVGGGPPMTPQVSIDLHVMDGSPWISKGVRRPQPVLAIPPVPLGQACGSASIVSIVNARLLLHNASD